MKTTRLFVMCTALLCATQLFAQRSSTIITPWVGVEGNFGSENVKTPSFGGNLEFFLDESLSLGATVNYSTISPEVSFTQENEETSGVMAGALVNYYWSDGDSKFRFYTGVGLGWASHDAPYFDSRFFYEVHAGGRYWISKGFALNAEVGYGLALLKAGISFGL